MKIKIDFHIHTKEDIENNIHYDAKELIDKAKREGFSAISITLHNKLLDDEKIKIYAKKKGILLIKGIEKTIQGHHVIIQGDITKSVERINTFQDLKRVKKKNTLITAPHPFYPNILGHSCLKNKVYEYKDLFDAIEIQQLYTKFYNPNKKAIRAAKELKKALIANSDAHTIKSFGKHYTEINVREVTQDEIIRKIKNNETIIKTKPMSTTQAIKFVLNHIKQKIKEIKKA